MAEAGARCSTMWLANTAATLNGVSSITTVITDKQPHANTKKNERPGPHIMRLQVRLRVKVQ
eukprot:m.66012 g.66012  ORF g.66012 m.66012 type:complete len:62 (+) comp23633_c1_seq1:1103-1288(+)